MSHQSQINTNMQQSHEIRINNIKTIQNVETLSTMNEKVKDNLQKNAIIDEIVSKLSQKNTKKDNIESSDISKDIFIFRYKRRDDEDPLDQLIVSSRAHKKLKIMTAAEQKDQQDLLCENFFEKLNIDISKFDKENQQQQINQPKQTINKQKSITSKGKKNQKIDPVQFFLTRISENDSGLSLGEKNEEKSGFDFHTKVDEYMNKRRSQFREQKFNKFRGIINNNTKQSNDKNQKRIKLVDLQDQNKVKFSNGESYGVQDFSSWMTDSKQKQNYEYYIIQKRKQIKQGKSIYLPEDVQAAIWAQHQHQKKFDDKMSQESINDQEDSNRQSNPDYDYPEEDCNEQGFSDEDENDDDDEGVLCREQYPSEDSDEDHINQDQLFRKYRKRCKKQYSDDSDVEYFPC